MNPDPNTPSPPQATDADVLHAPGKLFVFGEWAVLEGAPALVMPTPAGQRGVLRRLSAPEAWRYHAPALLDAPLCWTRDGDGAWHRDVQGEGDAAFGAAGLVEATLRAMSALHPEPLVAGVELEAHPVGLFAQSADGQRRKLGLGSSGGVCALVARAFARVCPDATRPDALTLAATAIEAHRAAQGGRGSGADVAVSVLNAPVVYRLGRAPGLGRSDAPVEPRVMRAVAPEGVEIAAVWSGQEADTRAMMQQMRAFEASARDAYGVHVRAVADAAASGIGAWRAGDVSGVLEATAASFDALDAFGRAANVPIVIEAHRDLKRRVEAAFGAGVAQVKPSGAGGGDMALVIARAGTLTAQACAMARVEPAFFLTGRASEGRDGAYSSP